MTQHRPLGEAELAECVAGLAAAGRTAFIRGAGSKADFGRPVDADCVIDVSGLAGVLDYEPSELYITVRAGTALPQILETLAPHRQVLAFEPPDWAALYGHGRAQTAGGLVACNLAGPRRIRAGAVRDHFLGFAAVNGQGAVWRAGAKVVKNVSGYDMAKLQCGAFGTLSVLTEITFRLLPAPETSGSVVFAGLAMDEAVTLMARALNSPFEVSAAAYLPAAAASWAAADGGLPDGALTVLRVEGHAPSVAYRIERVAALARGGFALDADGSVRLWERIGAVQPLLGSAARLLWRLCPPPAAAASLWAALETRFPGSDGFVDWGGGLVWLSLEQAGEDAGAADIRGILSRFGGHATLVRAPEAVRRRVPVFEPQPAPLARLAQRVKDAFDPKNVLNPGRLTAAAGAV